MIDLRYGRILATAAAAVALVALLAPPAEAQVGTLRGRVVDEKGQPVADMVVTFDFQGDQVLKLTSKTNAKGEWIRAGLRATDPWTITAQKGDLIARRTNVTVPIGNAETIADMIARPGALAPVAPPGGGSGKPAPPPPPNALAEAEAAMTANNFDVAITKFTEAAGFNPKCTRCYLRLGDAQLKNKDAAAAEKSFLKVIEIDSASPDAGEAYGALAIIYNEQRKFDEASKMAERARAMAPAGGDANSTFNAGAILFNQGKVTEAKVQFQRAIELNPNLAEAHYSLALCLINENKVAEARTSLQTYLKLAPSGTNAATAKAILDTLK